MTGWCSNRISSTMIPGRSPCVNWCFWSNAIRARSSICIELVWSRWHGPPFRLSLPALRRMRDFQRHAFYASSFIAFNTATPPFNDVRVRYAFNMATDKQRIAALYGAGNTPARSVIPPSASYQPVEALQTYVDGIKCDILAFDPGAARQQLRPVRERIPSTIRILSPNPPRKLNSRPRCFDLNGGCISE